jgi:hypothetical protein
MTGSIVIAPRFCGPPDSGNGGYVCGLIAACLDGPAQITLRRPPPLATPMTVERDGQGAVRVLDGRTLIAGARSAGVGRRMGFSWSLTALHALDVLYRFHALQLFDHSASFKSQ